MGNNQNKVSIYNFNKTSSNMSFTLNNDATLINFVSRTVNQVFIDNLNSSNNLSLLTPLHIPLDSSANLKESLSYSQTTMDLIDKNVDVSSIDVPDVKSEEVLNSYHQIVKNSRNNSNSSIGMNNMSINSISSIHGSHTTSRPDSSQDFTYSTYSTTINGGASTSKTIRTIKIGRKEEFTISGSKEKTALKEIPISKAMSYKKKTISPPRGSKVNMTVYNTNNEYKLNTSISQVNSERNTNSNNKKNKVFAIDPMKKAMSPPNRQPQGKISLGAAMNQYYNLPKSLSPTQSASTNYSTVSSKKDGGGSYVKMIKQKKEKKITMPKGSIGNMSLDNIRTKSKSKEKKSMTKKERFCSLDNKEDNERMNTTTVRNKSKPKMVFELDFSNLDNATEEVKEEKKNKDESSKIMNKINVKVSSLENSPRRSPPQKVYKNSEKLQKLKLLKQTINRPPSQNTNQETTSVLTESKPHVFQSNTLKMIYKNIANSNEHHYTSNTYQTTINKEDEITEEEEKSKTKVNLQPSGGSTSRFSFNKKSTPKFEKKIDINDYITNKDEDTQSIASRKINFKINANIDESEFNEMDFLN